MTNEEKKSIHDNVMTAIDSGRLQMRHKWHFVVKAVLLIVGIVLLVLALLYLVSLIVFVLHQTGVWFAPNFGARGLREFLFGLPWILILLVVVFIVLLEILVKKYSFSYRKPLLYSALGIGVIVVAGGFVVALTPVHRGLFHQAQDDHLPFAGALYRQFGAPPRTGNVVIGEVVEVLEDGYKILTPPDTEVIVRISDDTVIQLDDDLDLGDLIMVIGERDENTIEAYGVREVGEDIEPFHRPPHPEMR